MSRGYYLKLHLFSENDVRSEYQVTASGWDQPQEKDEVGSLIIDLRTRKIEFHAKNEWVNEQFDFPELDTIINKELAANPHKSINKKYGWWHMRMISSVRKLLTETEDKNEIVSYQ